MDQETIRILITGAAGVLGAFVGAAGALLVSERQHKRTLEGARIAERRARARDSALECDRAFEALASDITTHHQDRGDVEDEYRRTSDRIRSTCDRLERLAVDLPAEWRERVLEGHSFMQHAEELGSGGYGQAPHYHSVGLLVRNVHREAHELLASFLRNDPSPPPASDLWIEYRAAYAGFVLIKEDEYAVEIAEDDSRRSAWLDQHPEVREAQKHPPSP